jgi:hypothetical protein
MVRTFRSEVLALALVLMGSALLAAAGLVAMRPWLLERALAANERQAIEDLRAFARANETRGPTFGYLDPDTLLHCSFCPIQTPSRMTLAARNGYRFEFRPGPVVPTVDLGPAYSSFVYVARPLVPERTGSRSFAYFAPSPGLRMRAGGGEPSVDNAPLKQP